MEAERLRREQKRCHRERLRAKEQSLLKQIQAYDSYILDARRELEQEFEAGVATSGGVRPQIKQPRVAEKNSNRKSESSETINTSLDVKINETLKHLDHEEKESTQVKTVPNLQTPQSEIQTVSEVTSVSTDLSIKEEDRSELKSKDEDSVVDMVDQESKNISITVDEKPSFLEQEVSHMEKSLVKTEVENGDKLQLIEHISKTQETVSLEIDEKGASKLEVAELNLQTKEVISETTIPHDTSQDISEDIKSEISEDIEVEIQQTQSVPLMQEEVQEDVEMQETSNSPSLVKVDENEDIEIGYEERPEITTDAPSQESLSAETSVETTIESPRRGVNEVEVKKDDSDEDINESLPDTSASSDELQEDVPTEDKEQEVERITEYLLQQLVSDSVNSSFIKVKSKMDNISNEISQAADRIAEILSQELLDEALNQVWPIYIERKNERYLLDYCCLRFLISKINCFNIPVLRRDLRVLLIVY